MTSLWTHKRLVLSVATATLLAAVAASTALGYREPVSSAALGPDWQCTRVAFVFTTCSKIVRARPSVGSAAEPACFRRTDIARAAA